VGRGVVVHPDPEIAQLPVTSGQPIRFHHDSIIPHRVGVSYGVIHIKNIPVITTGGRSVSARCGNGHQDVAQVALWEEVSCPKCVAERRGILSSAACIDDRSMLNPSAGAGDSTMT